MKNNKKYRDIRMPLKAIGLSVGLSLTALSPGHSAEFSMTGPELVLTTPSNGPFASDQPIPTTTSNLNAGPTVTSSVITSTTSTITVRYATTANPLSCTNTVSQPVVNWDASAQAAYSYAANLWANQLHSTQPIVIDACWTSLASNILGSAGPELTGSSNSSVLPMANTWYPRALADALFKEDLHVGQRDIITNFNQNFAWYYGTDGNPPAGQFDFVTVVLHEIGHGLGFVGGGNVSGTLGTVLLGGFPIIFSQLTEDGNGVPLLSYAQNSVALGDALTGKVGGGVFFTGSNAVAANQGNAVPLYSPTVWNGGSSYSHLSNAFNGTSSSLMTFSVNPGVAQHTPGPVALGLLRDIGWPTDNDQVIARGLGGFSYDASSNNLPHDARGTLSLDFDFTNTGTESLRNVYLLVSTANTASLSNATTTDNNGGVGSYLSVLNSSLPGGGADPLFSNGETLTVPLDIDIAAGGAWTLDFDVIATDELLRAQPSQAQQRKVASFTLNSTMFEAEGLMLAATDPAVENTLIAEGNVLTGRIDPVFTLLLAVATIGFIRRRKAFSANK